MATIEEQRRANGVRIESERRAIGSRIEAERRATGRRIESERRAIGARIEAERTGKSVVEDINSLVQPVRQRRTLRTVAPVGALPPTRGRGNYVPPAVTSAGVASPFTETLYADRQYWPETLMQSSDGLLSFKLRAIKQIDMTDDNSAPVVQIFAAPSAAP